MPVEYAIMPRDRTVQSIVGERSLAIRKTRRNYNVLTTSDAESDVCKTYDLHANCYVRKPVDLAQFMHAVQTCKAFWLGIARLPAH